MKRDIQKTAWRQEVTEGISVNDPGKKNEDMNDCSGHGFYSPAHQVIQGDIASEVGIRTLHLYYHIASFMILPNMELRGRALSPSLQLGRVGREHRLI